MIMIINYPLLLKRPYFLPPRDKAIPDPDRKNLKAYSAFCITSSAAEEASFKSFLERISSSFCGNSST